MKVFTYSEARQRLSTVLDLAREFVGELLNFPFSVLGFVF